MNARKKAITVFGIIALLVGLNFMVFQIPGIAEPVSNSTETVNNSAPDEVGGIIGGIAKFISYTGFRNATPGHLIMIVVGLFFIFLAIK